MKGERRQSPTKRGGEKTVGLPPGETRKYLFIAVTKTEHQAVKQYCATIGVQYNAWVRGLIFGAIDEGQIREARAAIHRTKPGGSPGETRPIVSDGGNGSPGRGVSGPNRVVREMVEAVNHRLQGPDLPTARFEGISDDPETEF